MLSNLNEYQRLQRLEPPSGKVAMVLDTDTFNEIDDQFAVVYALLSQEQLAVEALYAAPFHNERSQSPGDGMEQSYAEILRLLQRLGRPHEGFVYRGATTWLHAPDQPVSSPAVDDLVERAMQERAGPLYVVAIGAITNIVSALLTRPEISERIVVIWLGGNPQSWHHTREFNLSQDLLASQVLFDCGVPLVHVPCINVAEHLRTTQAELERFVQGRGRIGDYLYEIYSAYYDDHYARSKELWDLGPIAWLVNPAWTDSVLAPSPILTERQTWSHDPHRHLLREVRTIRRDAVFADLFRKLERANNG